MRILENHVALEDAGATDTVLASVVQATITGEELDAVGQELLGAVASMYIEHLTEAQVARDWGGLPERNNPRAA
ncbi:hypothetical protein [Nocardioides sp.]|uniref:hypothetical protein n=1 Tax=Nocardioides sp. TaxID=35761 RepID=UPI0032198FAA